MFQGFSGATVDFLWGIRFNNERSWFEAHKEEYQTHLLSPMKALSAEVYDRFHDKHPDLPMVCKVSRIYRDARRLFGRGPYKDHLWLSLHRPHEARSTSGPRRRPRRCWRPGTPKRAFPSAMRRSTATCCGPTTWRTPWWPIMNFCCPITSIWSCWRATPTRGENKKPARNAY